MYKTTALKALEHLADKCNYQIELFDKDGWLGKIHFANGKSVFFSSSTMPINDNIPANISRDKLFTYQLLDNARINYPKTKAFFRVDYQEYVETGKWQIDGTNFIESFEWGNKNLVIKPNSLHSGKGITITNRKKNAIDGYKTALSFDYIVLFQEFIDFKEYRFIYLDGEMLWVYQKVPGHIIGNGQSTISELLHNYFTELQQNNRLNFQHSFIETKTNEVDKEILSKVLNENEVYFVEDKVLNLSLGSSIVPLENVNPYFSDICRSALKSIGLRYGAVDIRIQDIGKSNDNYAILEINSSPQYKNAWELGYKEKVLEIHEKILSSVQHS